MKKNSFLLLVLVMICSTMLTGCAVSGTTWKLKNLELDDSEIWAEDYIEENELDMTLEFKQDGTVVF